MRRARPLDLVVAATAVAGFVALLALPRGLMSGDEGVKLIQAQGLVTSGFRSRELPYPGAEMDPEGRHFPLRPPFAWQTADGRRYGLYPTPFVAVSALGWRLFGLRGIYLLPWLAAVVSVWLSGILARRATGSERWAAAVAGAAALATPLLLYGTLHWEHTTAVALVVGAFMLLSGEPDPWRTIAAGALVGAGPAIRTELYCLPLAVIAFVLVNDRPSWRALRRLLVTGGAAIAVAGVFWLWNRLTLGTWDPVITVTQTSNARLRGPSIALFLPEMITFWNHPKQLIWLAVAVGLLPDRLRHLRTALTAVVALWAGVVAVHAFSGPDKAVMGLLYATPLLILGFARGPLGESRLAAACGLAALVFSAAVYETDLERHGGGLQLGSRYLLPVVPLLLVAAADVVRSRPRALGPVAGVLCALSIALNVVNLRGEIELRRGNAQVLDAVRRSGVRDVVTNFFWAPQILAPLNLDHRVYRNPDQLLLANLLAHGIHEVVRVHGGLIPQHGYRVNVEQKDILLPPQQVIVYSLRAADAEP